MFSSSTARTWADGRCLLATFTCEEIGRFDVETSQGRLGLSELAGTPVNFKDVSRQKRALGLSGCWVLRFLET